MAEYTKIKLRTDSQANWLKYNPVLLRGELAISFQENDEVKIKIGDGTTAYALLPFFGSISKEEIEALLGDYAKKADIPTANSELTNDSGYITMSDVELKNYTTLAEVTEQGFVKNSELATVAKTGSYNDLSDRPNIPEGVVVDTTLNINSDNAISNKAVTTKINTMDTAINSKTTMGEVEAKQFQTAEQVEQKITSKGYQTASDIEQTLLTKDFATNARVTKIEAKIPTDTVSKAELLAVENIANSKTTLTEVAQQGYAKKSEIPAPITIDTELSDLSENPVQNKILTEKLNTLKGEIDSKTTMGEVEQKQYQTSAQVEQAITSKGYTTLTEVGQQGYAKDSEVPKTTEQWSFTMEDGSTVTKDVYIK